MSKTKSVLAAIIIVSSIIYGCSKPSNGSPGATGAKGTANVMYSSWSSLAMTYNTTDSAYEQTIVANAITQPILDSGMVLCYIKYSGSSNQVQVENANAYMETVFGLNSIALYSYVYDFTGISFRYIVVPGGVPITGRTAYTPGNIQGYTRAQWNAMPYEKAIAIINSTTNAGLVP
jgi:hypothetical protein